MHFREWFERLRVWAVNVLVRRWWVLALLVLYKIGEDRILGEVNAQLEGRGEPFATARWVVNAIPEFTLWLLIPAVVLYLIIRSYQDSKPVAQRAAVAPVSPRTEPLRRTYDGVEWAYAGTGSRPDGPFCPVDHTPLAYLDKRHYSGEKLYPYYLHGEVHVGDYWGVLRCLTCSTDYGADWNFKTVDESNREVRRLFEGMENRGEV